MPIAAWYYILGIDLTALSAATEELMSKCHDHGKKRRYLVY